ncbi:hypothetical protein [Lewinella cohaerens]|uniref:hypothetical protein n=1 Tax=Lewinella cohaerens TaxID=70995 RepID=UPI0003790371|nr:hypothetical protein [Lewinella cohaerens]
MKNTLFIGFFILSCSFIVNGQNASLVTNGAFNGNPAFTAWEIQEVESATVSQRQGGNPGGYIWLNDQGGDTDPSVEQEIYGLTIGKQYTIIGDYRAGKDAVNNCQCPGTQVLAIDIDGKEIATLPMPEHPSGWVQFTAVFTATSTSQRIRFRAEINGTDGDVALDNISVMPKMADWYQLKKVVDDRGR